MITQYNARDHTERMKMHTRVDMWLDCSFLKQCFHICEVYLYTNCVIRIESSDQQLIVGVFMAFFLHTKFMLDTLLYRLLECNVLYSTQCCFHYYPQQFFVV